MRCLIIVGLAFTTVSCATHTVPQPPVSAQRQTRPFEDQRSKVFCFVDGRTTSCDDLQRYPSDAIDHIEVLKGVTAVELYGLEAMSGAILVSTRSPASAQRPAPSPSDNIFYFIDGYTASRTDFQRLVPDTIDSIQVLKGATAIARYGSRAAAGAILVATKRGR